MKVAVWYHLGGGGAKRALQQHVQGLTHAGHHVEVWTPSTSRVDFFPLSGLCTEHVDQVDEQAFRGAVGRLGLIRAALRPRRGLDELDRHFRRCSAEIARRGFDVLFANTCQYNAVPDLAGHVGLPSVLYLQEPHRISYEAHPVLPWVGLPHYDENRPSVRRTAHELVVLRSARALARAEITAVRRYSRVLVNSAFSRESVLRAYGIDAQVCYLGVDTAKFRPATRPSGHYLLGVGQVVEHKRVDLIIQAVGRLPTPRPPLIWVGDRNDPGYQSALTELANRCGVDIDIRVSVSDDELSRLYANARAVVHAARLEPFGYTPLEAAAAGVPAVVVNEGGMRETVSDGVTGWVAQPTVEGLAAALIDCLSDPDGARRRGQRGRDEVADRWSLTAACERLQQHLLDVVDEARAGVGP